ncbi:family 43 glycosylhydrolase [Sphingomonas sp. GM_Shp_2]|uniref:family 43 glycosylhydrolase n=1 Tax=Sphingomonas sp. GM_Shp_2 TaxID=2937380 RepID=UPI002269A10B|nr:family 43 glycosylhydrolase [Sphingomonas sp. GM_Shp_2]
MDDPTNLPNRRTALKRGLAVAATIAAPPLAAAPRPGPQPGPEGQRRADLGNGSYINPVLAGDRADPNVLKDGDDYYAAFSSFVYYPAVCIWHSRDLVNWTPVGPVVEKPIGSVFAVDLARHDGRYFVYIPVFVPPAGPPKGPPFKIFVCHAEAMTGPWSEPVDMGIDGYIDPGHVVGEDGRRYLFLNDGHRVAISADGLHRDGPVEKVYQGWPIPDNWVIEGFALEGPKLIRRDGWFYMFSGQGGTAGPPTSHMVVVARARSIDGPWENCPHNPIVRTATRDEPWWSRGHATPVEGPDGGWWLAYHGYENNRRTLGRQMLLDPFVWDRAGWPRALGGDLRRPLPKPGKSIDRPKGFSLSDDFVKAAFGTRLSFYDPKPGYLDRVRLANNALHLKGAGNSIATSSPLAMISGDHRYSVTVDIDLATADEAGLLLFYNDKLFCGVGISNGQLHAYKVGTEQMFPPAGPANGSRMFMRVENVDDVATFRRSSDGHKWETVSSFEVSGYNHNIGDGFLSLRPAIFAIGGEAVFRSLQYRALD